MPSIFMEEGPMGLSAFGQQIVYGISIALIFAGLLARFWSYRGDKFSMSGIPPKRWLGDVCVVTSLIVFLGITCVQLFILTKVPIMPRPVISHSLDWFPDDTLSGEEHILILKSLYASRICYCLFIYLMKGGYITHYLSILDISSLRLRVLLNITILLTISGCLATTMATAMYCLPVQRVWTIGEAEGCNPFQYFYMVAPLAYINVTLDLMILAYPIVTILQLHISFLLKCQYLGVVIVTGIWPALAATWRFYLVIDYLDDNGVYTSPQSVIALASQVEMASLLILVSLPAYRVLRRKWYHTYFIQKYFVRPIKRFYRRQLVTVRAIRARVRRHLIDRHGHSNVREAIHNDDFAGSRNFEHLSSELDLTDAFRSWGDTNSNEDNSFEPERASGTAPLDVPRPKKLERRSSSSRPSGQSTSPPEDDSDDEWRFTHEGGIPLSPFYSSFPRGPMNSARDSLTAPLPLPRMRRVG